MRGIKIKKFFEIVNPEYHVFKLTTNNSVRNNTTGHIATAIASIHMQIWRQIEKDKIKLVKCLGKDFLIGTKYTFNQKNKVLMYIHIEKESVNFFVLIPSRYEKILLEKMSSNWKGVTIEKVNEIEVLSSDSTKFSMLYDKEDPLSLRIDLRDNDLLSAQLNVLNFMEKEDKAAIIYNFIPVAQNTWKSRYDATISKIKEKQPIDREKTGYTYLFKRSMGIFIYVLETIFEAIGTKSYKNEKVLSESLLDGLLGQSFDSLSKSTIYKRTAINLDVQIIIAAKSKDKLRQNNLAKSLVQSFDVISEDNRLKGKKYKGNIDDLTKFIFASAERNTVSDREASNLLALPGRSLLEQYGCIPKIETHETLVPEDLQNGDICVGTNVFRGNRKKAFLTTDSDYKYLSLALIGPTRAGKSTLMENLAVDAVKAGESVIVFDYIDQCQLSEQIASQFKEEQVLRINCADPSKIQGLGFNEVDLASAPNMMSAYADIKKQSSLLTTLINAINEEDLTSKMTRYLQHAGNLVFSQHGSFKDVFDVLTNYNVRHYFINNTPRKFSKKLEESMKELCELDDEKNGTKFNKIEGIIDRFYSLKSNAYLEEMLETPTEHNINLIKEIEKSQVICIQLPDHIFSTDREKDVLCTYWINKLWLTLQMRSYLMPDRHSRKKCNLLIDELHTVPNTEGFLKEQIQKVAKYSIKPIISCHYINQLKEMKETLKAANTSYMFISGCDKKNYEEFKDELYPFTVEDMLNLPRYHAINCMKRGGTNSGRATFITQLPPPLKTNK